MREAQALALVVDTPCAYVLQSGKAETNSYLAVLSMHFTSPFYAFLDDRTQSFLSESQQDCELQAG